MEPPPEAQIRIGELSRRVGVSPELLRAWEQRYRLLRPTRSAGGFRLYSEADEQRVRRMKAYLAHGLAAAEAARLAANGEGPAALDDLPAFEASVTALREALERYDEPAANALLDRLLGTIGTDTVLAEILLPTLRALGERWSEGDVTIAQEHFASNLLRGRLAGLARGWGGGRGSQALLACPAGELHDLGLIVFGIALRGHGWRIAYLGADTPIATLRQATATLAPRAVVVAAVTPAPLLAVEPELAELAAGTTLALGGPGAEPMLAERVGAVLLDADPITSARRLSRSAAA